MIKLIRSAVECGVIFFDTGFLPFQAGPLWNYKLRYSFSLLPCQIAFLQQLSTDLIYFCLQGVEISIKRFHIFFSTLTRPAFAFHLSDRIAFR